MNTNITKLLMKLLSHYQASVQDIAHEKNKIVKEAQAKIDALKIEHVKKQINQYDQSGN
ncbi:hypothetical protein GYA54_04575 [Candidatus Kuenenbacteria bacterium]|nr:hypothetical protein [Candidatus Kuenenbacteria bacterium]